MDPYFQIPKHFAHPEHPLILTNLRNIIESRRNKLYPPPPAAAEEEEEEEEKVAENNRSNDDDEEDCSDADEDEVDLSIPCNLCDNRMLESSAYSCISCDFHLHKMCAKLPEVMNHHPLHDPGHPLTLLESGDEGFGCHVCYGFISGYSYNCHSCNFHLHVGCASEAQVINHKGHGHPLRLFLRDALFLCNSCGTKHQEGVSYKCNTCPFWVHEDCATLPTTVRYRHHSHPLSLDAPDVTVLECQVCDKRICSRWMYKCEGCVHAVHVDCLVATLLAE